MKALSIGDIHGRSEHWKQFLIDEPAADKIIFAGDFVDSFDKTNEQIEDNLLDIIQFKKDNMDKVILLMGNHDIQYALCPPSALRNPYSCSGYRPESHFRLHEIFQENKDLFQAAYQYKEHIWTHAGIHRGWYENRFIPEFNKHFESFEGNIADKLNEAFRFELPSLFDVGYIRWGSKPVGGIFWADKNETSHKPLKNYHQIVGHTQVEDIKHFSYPKFDCSITYIDCIDKPYVINL
jgi:predicted MPP superfamily phosphohydrolase